MIMIELYLLYYNYYIIISITNDMHLCILYILFHVIHFKEPLVSN